MMYTTEEETATETTNTTTQTRTSGSGARSAKPGSNNSSGASGSNTGNITGDADTSTGDTSRMPEEFDGQPPEMCDANDEDCKMPEPPEGFTEMGPSGDGNFPGATTGQDTPSDSILHPVGYLALGGVSVIVAMVIVYACFSKCFHKKPGQTFDKGSKFAWYCVASTLLAAGLIALCYFIPIWVS